MIRLKPQIIAITIVLLGSVFISATKETDAFFGLTSVVRWINETDYDYTIDCPEQNKHFVIPAHQMREGGNYETNVPWVGPPGDFSFGHVIGINAPNSPQPAWFIWQRNETDGDKVRAGTKPAIPGTPIKGHAYVDGRRYLHITKDGVMMEVEPKK